MVGYLPKADCPTMGHLTTWYVCQIPTIAPSVPKWGVVREYIDKCIRLLQLNFYDDKIHGSFVPQNSDDTIG